MLQNSPHTDTTSYGACSISTETPEATEDHTEAISFIGALSIPVSEKCLACRADLFDPVPLKINITHELFSIRLILMSSTIS